MRNQEWLENRLEYLYRKYFYDLNAPNQIEIVWGKKTKKQLGCIRREKITKLFDVIKKNFKTIITINGYLRDESIPKFIIDAVILHELSHYSHGFNSPLPQIYSHPHKHGVVRKELQKRGIINLEKRQRRWLQENWLIFLKKQESKR